MKRFFTLSLILLSIGLQAQTIYVKQGAAGANSGASWADAYTSLEQALSVASPNQTIWVAAGTYKSSAASNLTFLVSDGMQLYGGFAGTETALSQRNIAANPTILSGDINGDDIPGDFTTNRSDNAQHVVTCVELSTNNGILVDGFIIRSGHTLSGAANPDLTRRGGGIQIIAKTTLRNCTFQQNFGDTGAAIAALDGLSNGLLVEDCLIEQNNAEPSGVFFLRNTANAEIKNCTFRNNTNNRGALYPSGTTNLQINNCLFEGNNAGANFGGGMFSWQASWDMNNCTFRGNKAANAAGIYLDNRDGGDVVNINNSVFEFDTTTGFGGSGLYGWQATFNLKNTIFRNNNAPNAAAIYCNGREFDSDFTIEGCTFENNVNTDYGATFWNNRTNYIMSNCTFKNNVAPSSGAGVYNGDTTLFQINNCLFEANSGNYAAAVANYGIGCYGTYNLCTFRENQAGQGGGAASNGFKANAEFANCNFIENRARFGGAIFTQNDTTRLRVTNSYFTGNITDGSGTAIYVNTNIAADIRSTTFYQNFGDIGTAIYANGDSLLNIDGCYFIENFATTQGAAINLNHANAVLTNCLFAKNINSGDGAGGAISSNVSDGEIGSVKAINCTFADNIAAIGAGIAQWEESDMAVAEVTLLNCLFQNPDGDNYAIEQGSPDVISLGGNQSSDQTLSSYLTATLDQHGVFHTFENPDNNEYRPTAGSPAADAGVADGAPQIDITGFPRFDTPDVGCYEFSVSGVKTPGIQALPLTLAPNPAVDHSILSFEHERNGRVLVTIWNQAGQKVAEYRTEKQSNSWSFQVPVREFAAGVYQVQAQMGAVLYGGMLVKQ